MSDTNLEPLETAGREDARRILREGYNERIDAPKNLTRRKNPAVRVQESRWEGSERRGSVAGLEADKARYGGRKAVTDIVTEGFINGVAAVLKSVYNQ